MMHSSLIYSETSSVMHQLKTMCLVIIYENAYVPMQSILFAHQDLQLYTIVILRAAGAIQAFHDKSMGLHGNMHQRQSPPPC